MGLDEWVLKSEMLRFGFCSAMAPRENASTRLGDEKSLEPTST